MSKTWSRASALAVLVLGATMTLGPVAGARGKGGPDRGPSEPTGPAVVLDVTEAARGDQVIATTEGCRDGLRYTELRLVVGQGGRHSVAVTTDGGSGQAAFTVPDWAPNGWATVEASCLEPNFSGGSDGAEVLVSEFVPATLRVRGGSARVGQPRVAITDWDPSMLHVSGSQCDGSVRLALAAGRDRVSASDRFHYGHTFATADGSGGWSADVPLRYSVSSFSDPVAPGPMVLFASCGDQAYEPVTFRVGPRSPAPPVTVLEWDPAGLFLSQCLVGNTLSVQVEATTADGTVHHIEYGAAGPGYGEFFQWLDLPPETVHATYEASCTGGAGPSFRYAPAEWAAA